MGSYAQALQHKQDVGDEERHLKAQDFIDAKHGALVKLPALKDQYGEDSPQYKDALKTIQDSEYGIGQLYHPDKAPGAIQKDFHWLLERMHGIKQPKTPPSGAPQAQVTPVNIPVAPISTPELPAYDQTTPRLASQGGSTVEHVPGVAASTGPGMASPPQGATPTMAVAKPTGLVEAGNIPIWNRPNVLNDDGTHSSELSISIGDEKGNQTLIPLIVDGRFLTPNGKMPPGDIPHNAQEWEKASPEWKALKMRAENHYKQTGQHLGKFGGGTPEENESNVDAYAQVLHNRGAGAGASGTLPAPQAPNVTKAPPVPWGQAQVLKQKAAAMQKAQEQAQLLAAGVGLSPQQQAISGANTANAGELARIQGQIKNYKTLNPDATDEDVAAYASSLMPGNNQVGNWEVREGEINGQPYPISYDKKRGVYKLPDNTISSTPPENWKPSAKASGIAGEELREYQSDPDPNKGTITEWKAKKAAGAKGLAWDTATGQVKGGPNGRRYNPWDADLPPDVRGMFKAQADTMAKKQANALQLAVARGSASAQARMVDVQDPQNPGQNIIVPAGLAYKLGYNTPNGAYYAAMTNMLKDATSGQIGNEFVAFGTALQHADQLGRAATALANGDSRSLNSIANGLSTAFGDPAVTNFDVVSQVYTGEITKAINAGHVTQSELQDNHALIPANASPAQIQGAINNFKTLLNSKINNRVPQIQSVLGKFGMATPFMPPGYTPPSHGGSGGGAAPKTKVSLAKARTLDRYKGMTDAQITADLQKRNREVVP